MRLQSFAGPFPYGRTICLPNGSHCLLNWILSRHAWLHSCSQKGIHEFGAVRHTGHYLLKYLRFSGGSVPSKKILHRASVCFSERTIAQPCRHTTIGAVKGLCDVYTIFKHATRSYLNIFWQCLAQCLKHAGWSWPARAFCAFLDAFR